MGAWGKLQWDNDGAADWFAELFQKTKLATRVEETLRLNVDSSYEEIRAAASVLLFLGRNYIWPVEDLDRHLALAVDRLEAVSGAADIAESPELVEEIRAEIQELRSRIKTPGSQSQPAPPKKWWQFLDLRPVQSKHSECYRLSSSTKRRLSAWICFLAGRQSGLP